MRRLLSILLILVLMSVAVAFTALNLGVISFDFYFIRPRLPVAVAVFLFVLLGALLGVLASSSIWIRQARANRSLRRRLENCEKELASLRNLPVKDST